MTRSAATTREVADRLFRAVEGQPLVSVHNGLPARYLADDLPVTDPINLLVTHDQGVQALLRAQGIRPEFSPSEDWHLEASRRAFALLWDHLVAARAQAWMAEDGDEIAMVAGLPPFRPGRSAEEIYDEVSARLVTEPLHPRRVLDRANLAMLFTSDEPTDDLLSHAVLAEDSTWAGRVAPTFSADRYLQPGARRWRTDGDLLAEITGIDTGDLEGFVEALRRRREFFVGHGASIAEFHLSDVGASRLGVREAADLYQLARSGDLLPDESVALQRHLVWEMAAMSADDGLVLALYPPAGIHPAQDTSAEDRGVASRVEPLLTDFGSSPRFRLWLFSIDADVYVAEIVPMAMDHPHMTAVPPTRFADDPDRLLQARASAVRALGPSRVLGLVDDMSGPLALVGRHRLARRLDAGALAELVVAGSLSESQAVSELERALAQSTRGSPAAQAV